ncbi:YphP/YqiW family bacillithiol system oxidoreductase [Paenisporosarcina sp. HGH0030]|uniref:BrxA/BrxB family bacilliredoxin n=1 Tax=Paenisporosarcina sp. HGH0030 TaxID=1078085 RepID=UPI00034E95E3|nr:BrxA/BrxB family bacilliredoxin [Paenisporosarcina sp. HGH0030]EPD53101.1 YphP/YqiW family bacillithiol system oxidoreductase [Paenisporosarcina sp. HGH0030]
MNAYDEYMKEVVKPMRAELVNVGFKELTTADMVNEHMAEVKGTSLVVINSVCGCAAGLARPAVSEALTEVENKPEHLVTVFAGQDQEATYQMRTYFEEVPPSSPSIAVVKDGQLAYFIPREQIEGFPMEQIKDHLVQVLNQVTSA